MFFQYICSRVIFVFFVVPPVLLVGADIMSPDPGTFIASIGPGALWGKRSLCDEEQGKSPIASFLLLLHAVGGNMNP